MRYSLLLLLLLAACVDHPRKEITVAAPREAGSDVPLTGTAAAGNEPVSPQQPAFSGIPDTLRVQLESGASLHPGQVISGKARGFFFYEAQFGLRLYDSSGKQLASAPARANGDWMTSGWLPFYGRLRWEKYSGPGRLVFEKANPSGLPEKERHYSVPVRLAGK